MKRVRLYTFGVKRRKSCILLNNLIYFSEKRLVDTTLELIPLRGDSTSLDFTGNNIEEVFSLTEVLINHHNGVFAIFKNKENEKEFLKSVELIKPKIFTPEFSIYFIDKESAVLIKLDKPGLSDTKSNEIFNFIINHKIVPEKEAENIFKKAYETDEFMYHIEYNGDLISWATHNSKLLAICGPNYTKLKKKLSEKYKDCPAQNYNKSC